MRSLGVEVVGEGIDAGLQFFDGVRQVVDGVEFIPPGRLGAFDASVEVWPFGGQNEEFEAAPLAFFFEDGFEPPSRHRPGCLRFRRVPSRLFCREAPLVLRLGIGRHVRRSIW